MLYAAESIQNLISHKNIACMNNVGQVSNCFPVHLEYPTLSLVRIGANFCQYLKKMFIQIGSYLCLFVCYIYLRTPCLGLTGGVRAGDAGAELPAEPRDEANDRVDVRGAEQPRYIADPLSLSRKSTREDGTEPEYKPAGLLRGRTPKPLTVLALRCKLPFIGSSVFLAVLSTAVTSFPLFHRKRQHISYISSRNFITIATLNRFFLLWRFLDIATATVTERDIPARQCIKTLPSRNLAACMKSLHTTAGPINY
ncbi:hypothetical protein GQX74_003887 [Glossina fuscipes]|nr:hypothetical protein GQX74_003887 [Glossina fuscipes]